MEEVKHYVNLIGRKCHIDDNKFVYVITGIMFRGNFTPQFECSYFDDAAPQSSWVEGWRVTVLA